MSPVQSLAIRTRRLKTADGYKHRDWEETMAHPTVPNAGAPVIAALIASALLAHAALAGPVPQAAGAPRHIVLTGHDSVVPLDEPVMRVTAKVTALGKPGADGHIYSIETSNTDFGEDELRSWQMTILSGALFGVKYRVMSNTASGVTVTNASGPLDKAVVGDLILLEELYNRDVPSRR
jgi:hypothetical protein